MWRNWMKRLSGTFLEDIVSKTWFNYWNFNF